MVLKTLSLKGVVAFFEKEYRDVVLRLDELQEATKNLQFEGKLFSGRNIQSIERVAAYLKNKLQQHIKLDEKIIFPFLETYVPKLEPILRFLRAERNEFKANLEEFDVLFTKVKESKNRPDYFKTVGELREKGIYLVGLVRNHIQAENESVYKIIDQQLRDNEKKELLRRCRQFKKP